MPLILWRKPGEQIVIGDDIWITVVKIEGILVHLAIEAPKHIEIEREERYTAKKLGLPPPEDDDE